MEHVILVAIVVENDSPTRKAAEMWLHDHLPSPRRGDPVSWWVAEDERYDGSDNDSAVFVRPGLQREATAFLTANGYTSQGVEPDPVRPFAD